MPRLLLAVAALSSLALGVAGLLAPEFVASRVGLAFANSLGRSEVMTFYGAFYFGMGAFLLTAVARRELQIAASMALTFAAAPAALVRLLTILLLGLTGIEPYLLFFGELLYALAGAVSWATLQRVGRHSSEST